MISQRLTTNPATFTITKQQQVANSFQVLFITTDAADALTEGTVNILSREMYSKTWNKRSFMNGREVPLLASLPIFFSNATNASFGHSYLPLSSGVNTSPQQTQQVDVAFHKTDGTLIVIGGGESINITLRVLYFIVLF